MTLLDGKKIAADIKEEIKETVKGLKEKTGKIPGLVTILVGDDPASSVYVKSKHKDCEAVGFKSFNEKHNADISEEQLLDIIEKYNNSSEYHGILVQLPLPKHINADRVIEAIDPAKDVDGFHPTSVGNLVIGKDTFYPCTPYGVVEILQRYGIETSGKHVVVVGRSNIVGKPVANMLLQKKEGANAVVTICHSAAKDLKQFTLPADIIIAAIGRANFITADMVKDGVVVVDVGINSIDVPDSPKGYKLVGDVDFESVAPKASHITPVPGGVGLMTRAMLLQNTLKAFLNIEKVS